MSQQKPRRVSFFETARIRPIPTNNANTNSSNQSRLSSILPESDSNSGSLFGLDFCPQSASSEQESSFEVPIRHSQEDEDDDQTVPIVTAAELQQWQQGQPDPQDASFASLTGSDLDVIEQQLQQQEYQARLSLSYKSRDGSPMMHRTRMSMGDGDMDMTECVTAAIHQVVTESAKKRLDSALNSGMENNKRRSSTRRMSTMSNQSEMGMDMTECVTSAIQQVVTESAKKRLDNAFNSDAENNQRRSSTRRMSTMSNQSEMGMDMTECVTSAIQQVVTESAKKRLDNAFNSDAENNQRRSSTRRMSTMSNQSEMGMDMTECVTSAIQQVVTESAKKRLDSAFNSVDMNVDNSKRRSAARRSSTMSSQSEMGMDMTECVGGILKASSPAMVSPLPASSSVSPSQRRSTPIKQSPSLSSSTRKSPSVSSVKKSMGKSPGPSALRQSVVAEELTSAPTSESITGTSSGMNSPTVNEVNNMKLEVRSSPRLRHQVSKPEMSVEEEEEQKDSQESGTSSMNSPGDLISSPLASKSGRDLSHVTSSPLVARSAGKSGSTTKPSASTTPKKRRESIAKPLTPREQRSITVRAKTPDVAEVPVMAAAPSESVPELITSPSRSSRRSSSRLTQSPLKSSQSPVKTSSAKASPKVQSARSTTPRRSRASVGLLQTVLTSSVQKKLMQALDQDMDHEPMGVEAGGMDTGMAVDEQISSSQTTNVPVSSQPVVNMSIPEGYETPQELPADDSVIENFSSQEPVDAIEGETMLQDLSMDLSMEHHADLSFMDMNDKRQSPVAGLTFADIMIEEGLSFMPSLAADIDLDALVPMKPGKNTDPTLKNEVEFYMQATKELQQLCQLNETYVAELEKQVDERLVDLVLGCSKTPLAPGPWSEEIVNFRQALRTAKTVTDSQISMEWLSMLMPLANSYTRQTFNRFSKMERDWSRIENLKQTIGIPDLEACQKGVDQLREEVTRAETRWAAVQRDAPVVQELLKKKAEEEKRVEILKQQLQELELEIPEMQAVQDELVQQQLELEQKKEALGRECFAMVPDDSERIQTAKEMYETLKCTLGISLDAVDPEDVNVVYLQWRETLRIKIQLGSPISWSLSVLPNVHQPPVVSQLCELLPQWMPVESYNSIKKIPLALEWMSEWLMKLDHKHAISVCQVSTDLDKKSIQVEYTVSGQKKIDVWSGGVLIA